MDYIKWIRSKVGHERIILNYSTIIVTNSKGEILLQKRSDNNMWGLPGGALELGESYEEAAYREVLEETGYKVEIKSMIGVFSKYFHTYPNGDEAQTISVAFEATILEDEKHETVDGETLDLKFVDPRKVPPLFNKKYNDIIDKYLLSKS